MKNKIKKVIFIGIKLFFKTVFFLERGKPIRYFGGRVDLYEAYFIHIPKAAGTSISINLFGHQVGHQKFRDVYRLNSIKAKNYFSFTFVRDPVDRFISAYEFLSSGGMLSKDRKYFKNTLCKFKDINEFIEYLDEFKIYDYIHFVPQFEFLCDDNDDIPKVNFIGKYENIDEDYNFIINKLKLNKKLIHKNKNTNKKACKLSEKSICKLKELYEKDYYLFGYDLEKGNKSETQ